MKTIRVIIATPSPVDRLRLAKTLSACPEVTLLSQVADLSQAYTDAEHMEPDVMLMAADFVRVDEFGCMQSLFYALGVRWVQISATGPSVLPRSEDNAAQDRPMVTSSMDATRIMEILRLVLAMPRTRTPVVRAPLSPPPSAGRSDRIVLIGSSTGGIDALLAVLSAFPADCPPTAIVQHTGPGFSESLVRLLDKRCAARVVAAEDGMLLTSGMVCVGGLRSGHLHLRGGSGVRCAIAEGAPISGHMPSVDALFQSAVSFASRVIAVLLTGMGRDGAAGLLDLRKAGASTIGQDEATSVVYGMPRVAWEMGAVQTQLPIGRIGPEILRLATTSETARIAAK